MVTQSGGSYGERRSTGDTAVDGLLCGMAAGAAMIVVLVALVWMQGLAPAEVLKAFGSRIPANPTNGLFSHLAVSAIYGIVWAFLLNTALRAVHAPRWLLGILYGLLLFAFAELLVAPSALLNAVSTPVLLIAHIVYGATLGLLSGRRWLQ